MNQNESAPNPKKSRVEQQFNCPTLPHAFEINKNLFKELRQKNKGLESIEGMFFHFQCFYNTIILLI